MRRYAPLFVLAVALIFRMAIAQTPNIGGGMVPNQPQVNIQGPITPGDCVKWVAAFTIGDSGAPCGSGGTACPSGGTDQSATPNGCNLPFFIGGVFP